MAVDRVSVPARIGPGAVQLVSSRWRHAVPDLPGTATNILHASTHQTDAGADTSSALVVTLLVDLDLSTVDTFRQAFAQLLAGDASPNADLLVFDLSRVDFVSIDGASALVEAKDRVVESGLDFRLVTATRGVEHALAATGARQMFERHATVGSALDRESNRAGMPVADPSY
ncbi:anti-anti-sigma factor [Prescottella equi]|nr:anti-anti-sigma factor [Prescottella equi]